MNWLGVFVRAVVVPAARRVAPAWIGCAIVGGLLFGKNAMHPRDVTTLALNNAPIGASLALIWVLIYLPAARILVRADAAAYLRSLPAPRTTPALVVATAFVALQLPWLVLWVLGDRARGLGVVAAMSLGIALVAAWRPPRRAPRTPAWPSGFAALRAIHLRALGRRAGDSLLRGVGLGLLAGAVGGLFVRNNQLVGPDAAMMGASVIAVVVVPAHVGPLVVLVESHRATAWLAASLGIAPLVRTLAVAATTLVVHLASTVIALIAFVLVAGANLYVIATALAIAVGSALGCTRVLVRDDDTSQVAARAVVGAVAVAAAAIAALGFFGIAGIVAFIAAMLLVLLR